MTMMMIMRYGHPTHPQWFEHQSVDTNMWTPSLPLRLCSLQSGLGVSCLCCFLGAISKHLRHDNSSNVVPTAACSTHAYTHTGTRTTTTSINMHGNCCSEFCPPGPLPPRSTGPPLVKPSLDHNLVISLPIHINALQCESE